MMFHSKLVGQEQRKMQHQQMRAWSPPAQPKPTWFGRRIHKTLAIMTGTGANMLKLALNNSNSDSSLLIVHVSRKRFGANNRQHHSYKRIVGESISFSHNRPMISRLEHRYEVENGRHGHRHSALVLNKGLFKSQQCIKSVVRRQAYALDGLLNQLTSSDALLTGLQSCRRIVRRRRRRSQSIGTHSNIKPMGFDPALCIRLQLKQAWASDTLQA